MTPQESDKIIHLCASIGTCTMNLRHSAARKVRQAPIALEVAEFLDRVKAELAGMTVKEDKQV